MKRPRAGDSQVSREPAQELDAPEPEQAVGPAPHAFISPSVKEYLELGVAIPGKFHWIMPAFLIKFIILDIRNAIPIDYCTYYYLLASAHELTLKVEIKSNYVIYYEIALR